MKILLAGPGTGKTSKIKELVEEKGNGSNVLILSFTNATVDDLHRKLGSVGVSEDTCMTVHKFAVKYNHDRTRHVVETNGIEEQILKQIAKQTGIHLDRLCDFFSCTTFDQMIDRFVLYAEANDAYLQEKLSKFETLIIDEYQDFNPHEQALIDLLFRAIPDVYVLGDDDQCIYDFKDASTDKIISFYENESNERIEHEHKCHRCPDVVVHHATTLIKKNTRRVDKRWDKSGKKGKLSHTQLSDFTEVGIHVATEIKRIMDTEKDSNVLVLSPVKFAVSELVAKLEEFNIPFANYFTERIPEELIESSWSLKTLFGRYKYVNLVFLGYRCLRNRNRRSFYDLLKRHYEQGQNFEQLFEQLQEILPDGVKREYKSVGTALASEIFSDLVPLYEKAEGEVEEEKLENMFRLENEVHDERVKIMSIHKSKGLDADHVFMVGLVEGIIPNKKDGNDSIEGYRRQFYVGMTRTRSNLYLISNYKIESKFVYRVNKEDFKFDHRARVWNGRASSFIGELGL